MNLCTIPATLGDGGLQAANNNCVTPQCSYWLMSAYTDRTACLRQLTFLYICYFVLSAFWRSNKNITDEKRRFYLKTVTKSDLHAPTYHENIVHASWYCNLVVCCRISSTITACRVCRNSTPSHTRGWRYLVRRSLSSLDLWRHCFFVRLLCPRPIGRRH